MVKIHCLNATKSQKLADVKFKCLREDLRAESRGSNSRVRLVSRRGEGIEGGRCIRSARGGESRMIQVLERGDPVVDPLPASVLLCMLRTHVRSSYALSSGVFVRSSFLSLVVRSETQIKILSRDCIKFCATDLSLDSFIN